jgi:hypothetical protein
MTYFSQQDHAALSNLKATDGEFQQVYDRLYDLHRALYRRVRDHNYDLHPSSDSATLIADSAAFTADAQRALTLTYFRSFEQAHLVERLMGRDGLNAQTDIETHRHPTIELRVTPDHFAIEMVLSRYAWWDQQNFIGKLAIQRHRDTFRNIMQRIGGDFVVGFWDGPALGDMHVTTRQLLRGNNLADWMSTFCDGQDSLRIGAWYDASDARLDPGLIVNEVMKRVTSLYNVYNFVLWTSNNDYHSFYRKAMLKTAQVALF